MSPAVLQLLTIATNAVSTIATGMLVKFGDLIAKEIWDQYKPAVRAAAAKVFKNKVIKKEVKGIRLNEKDGKVNTYIIQDED